MIEQTLAILVGQEGINFRAVVEEHLVKHGLLIKISELVHEEDLEEAGIEFIDYNAERDGELEHICLVLEGFDSVLTLKELIGKEGSLNKNCLKSLYPNLKIYASPSISAASMAIEILFPNLIVERAQPQENNLGNSISKPQELITSFNSSISRSNDTPSSPSSNVAPFALSNLSHPTPPRSNHISKAMERALALHDYDDDESNRVDVDVEQFKDQDAMEEGEDGEEEVVEILSASAEDAGTRSPPARRVTPPPSPSAHSFTSTSMTHSLSNSSTPSFRDDSRPSSKGNPHPRLTKTAKMRLGMSIEPRPARRPSTSQSNVSDLSKSTRVIAPVKSLAAPKVEVRTTKSSALRTGSDNSTTPVNSNRPREIASGTSDRSSNAIFDNTPGFKRRESITVSSTAPPKVEVRMTKGASLRAGLPVEATSNGLSRRAESGIEVIKKGNDKQTSTFGREEGGRMGPPIIKKKVSSSRMSLGGQLTGNAFSTRADVLEDLIEGGERITRGGDIDTPRPATKARRQSAIVPRMTKTTMMRLGTPFEAPVNRRNSSTPTNTYEGVPGHSGRETIPVASSRPPTIQPRTNRSTLLRMGSSENTKVTAITHSNRRTSSETATTSQSQSRPSSSLSQHAPSSIIPKVPKILPRMNRTEALRTAKKEKEEAERIKLASVKIRRPGEMRLEKPQKSSKPSALGDYSNGGDSPRRSTFAE